jgi:hypothetical protein
MMIFVALPAVYLIPGSDNGSYENVFNALRQISMSFFVIQLCRSLV